MSSPNELNSSEPRPVWESVILVTAYLVSSVVSIVSLLVAYDFIATRYFQ